jgi:hypothetical protein
MAVRLFNSLAVDTVELLGGEPAVKMPAPLSTEAVKVWGPLFYEVGLPVAASLWERALVRANGQGADGPAWDGELSSPKRALSARVCSTLSVLAAPAAAVVDLLLVRPDRALAPLQTWHVPARRGRNGCTLSRAWMFTSPNVTVRLDDDEMEAWPGRPGSDVGIQRISCSVRNFLACAARGLGCAPLPTDVTPDQNSFDRLRLGFRFPETRRACGFTRAMLTLIACDLAPLGVKRCVWVDVGGAIVFKNMDELVKALRNPAMRNCQLAPFEIDVDMGLQRSAVYSASLVASVYDASLTCKAGEFEFPVNTAVSLEHSGDHASVLCDAAADLLDLVRNGPAARSFTNLRGYFWRMSPVWVC